MNFCPALQGIESAEDGKACRHLTSHPGVAGKGSGNFNEISRLDGEIEVDLLPGVNGIEKVGSLRNFRDVDWQKDIAAELCFSVHVQCHRLQLQIVGGNGDKSIE